MMLSDDIDIDIDIDKIYTSKDGKYTSYISTVKFLSGPLFKKWRLNRPPDMNRVYEIRNYLIESKPIKVDGEILCAKIEDQWRDGIKVYEIYDGNHRREAILGPFTEICPDSVVLLTIINVKDDHELLEHFKRINKSIPLSAADLLGAPDISGSLHLIVKEYIEKYPNLVSTKKNPRRPRFNRDEFVDMLYKIYTNNSLDLGTIKKLLNDYNTYMYNQFSSILISGNHTKTVKGLTVTKELFTTAHESRLYIFLCKNLEIDMGEFYQKSIN